MRQGVCVRAFRIEKDQSRERGEAKQWHPIQEQRHQRARVVRRWWGRAGCR